MSRFYGTLSGAAKTPATRRGHRHIWSHTRGWNAGVEVVGEPDGEADRFTVAVTHGTNGHGNHTQILTVKTNNVGGPVVVTFTHPETGEQTTFTA